MLVVSAQGFLWKQDLKSGQKIPQREKYVNVNILHVKFHKKVGVLYLEDIRVIPQKKVTDLENQEMF